MISKQSTTRFSPNGAGGASRGIEPFPSEQGAPARAASSAGRAGDQIPVIWADVRNALRRRLGDVKFDSWLARLELVAEVNGEVLLSAASEHERTRVEADFGHFIQQAWSQADRDGRTVRIEARERISSDVMALARPHETVADEEFEAPSDEGVQPALAGEDDQTLENFMVGDSNRVAFGLARRLALGASVSAHVVTIVGPHGVGIEGRQIVFEINPGLELRQLVEQALPQGADPALQPAI
jgi:hypothetical protein